MKYITDTDFLPDVKDTSYDVYQLLYGVVYNGREDRIYDSIISLCRKHKEPLLRKAKIASWKKAILQVLSNLREKMDNGKNEVYVPFLSLHCKTERLINLYTFALDVLNEVYGVGMGDLRRKNDAKSEDVRSFYPIPNLVDIMLDFANKCLENNELGESASLAVKEEIARRGIDARFSSFSEEDKYEKIFFKADSLPKIAYEQQEEDTPKKKVKEEYVVKVGFLYYALKHYFSFLKPQVSQNRFNTLTQQATIRIAHGLYKPNEFFGTETQAGESIYSCVHYKKFNNISTESRKQNYDTIVGLLRKYKLTEPDEPLQKVKGEKPS